MCWKGERVWHAVKCVVERFIEYWNQCFPTDGTRIEIFVNEYVAHALGRVGQLPARLRSELVLLPKTRSHPSRLPQRAGPWGCIKVKSGDLGRQLSRGKMMIRRIPKWNVRADGQRQSNGSRNLTGSLQFSLHFTLLPHCQLIPKYPKWTPTDFPKVWWFRCR